MSLMELLNATDSYLVSLAVIGVIAARIAAGDDRSSTPFRLFLAMLALTAAEIGLDMASLALDGRTGSRSWLSAVYVAYFSIQPLTTYLWALYAYYQIHYDSRPLYRLALPAALPLALNAAIAAASPWTGWAFRVDEAGYYSRGGLFTYTSAIPFLYLFLITGLTLLHWRGLPRRTRATLLLFGLPPALGGFGQAMLYGTHLLWPGVTVALLFVYLSIESELLVTDHLTGLHNRRSFDRQLRRRLAHGSRDEPFALVMLDLDGFKRINDGFGHAEGDEALKAAAAVLRRCLHADDFIARYAGDEFVIVATVRDPDGASALASRIRRSFEAYNDDSGRPWRLSASVGTVTSDELPSGVEAARAKALVREADRRMYEDKGRTSR